MIVKYSKKFPYAPFLNEDIGFETSIEDFTNDEVQEEEALEALKKLKAIAEKFHKDNNPQLVEGGGWLTTFPEGHGLQSDPIPSIDRRQQERLEKLMDDCQTLDELMMHQAMAKELQVMGSYNLRRDQLTSKPSNTIQNESN